MRKNFEIVGEYNVTRPHRYDNQDTINLYVAQDLQGIRKQYLAPLCGKEAYKEITFALGKTLRVNGLYAYKDIVYGVMGKIVFKMDANGSISKLTPASLSTNNSAISWANNTSQIALADGAALYVYTITTNTFEKITLPDGMPSNPFVVYYQDARLFVRFQNDSRIYFSDEGDFTQLNSSNFEVQQSRPSVARGLSGVNDRLFLLGDASSEIWSPPTYPTVDPIIRDNNLIYEFGCESSASVVKGIVERAAGTPLSSFVAWLSVDPNGVGCFVLSTGGAPLRISNSAIELAIENFTNRQDCFGITYKLAGAIFIEWTFIEDNKTFVYELTSNTWTRREQNNRDASDLRGHAFAHNTHYFGSTESNNIYRTTNELMTDDGNPINRTRITHSLYDVDGKQLSVNEFLVYFESGYVDSLEDATAYLSISNDSGSTWTHPTPARIGRIGEYDTACRWHNLGTAYQFNFRIDVYDPIRVFIMGATCDYEVCAS